MNWQEEAVILSAKRHGERSWIVSVMTQERGRHAGLAKVSQKDQVLLQAGNRVQARWNARLPEHLGQWQFEMISSPVARIMSDPLRLTGLSSLVQLIDTLLPERHPYPEIWDRLGNLIDLLTQPSLDWLREYAFFELRLLDLLGYGLDLSKCAVTGESADLFYVSPKTGRAVSREAGMPYHEKLFTLPQFFLTPLESPQVTVDILGALRLTGHFIAKYCYDGVMPDSRYRLTQSVIDLNF